MIPLVPLVCFSVLVLWLSFTEGRGGGAPEERTGERFFTADSEGRRAEFFLDHVPERVLVTYPGATELLLTLGLGDKIAGTVAPYGEEPEELVAAYARLPLIAAPYVPSREEVSALRPDLIIGWSHHFTPEALGDVYSYFQKGVGCYIVPATVRKGRPTLEGTVYPFIEDVGKMFRVEEKAREYTAQLKSRVAVVEVRTKVRERRATTMILQSHGNSLYSLYGPGYIIDDIAAKAGADNVTTRQLRAVGPERVLAFDPDVILYVNGKNISLLEAEEELFTDFNLRNMRAVRERRVIVIPFAEVNNGNGRTVDALERIASGLDACGF